MLIIKQINHLIKYLLALLVLLFASATQAGQRIALVIGNAHYAQGQLDNPINDATDISQALKKLNFDDDDVTLLKDASRITMLKAVQAFKAKLDSSNAEVAFFYYAGHGAQYQGDSYLLPLQTQIASTADLPIEALLAKDLLGQMQASPSRVNIMVLDACRDLPFPQLKRGGVRGLARIEANSSALLAYSTSPGHTAADGNNGERNSPYTAALLKLLPQRNLTVTQLFNDVGVAVTQTTGGKQTPWISSSPMPRIYLAGQQIQPPIPPNQIDSPAIIPQAVSQIENKPITSSTTPSSPSQSAFAPKMVFIKGGTFTMGCISGKHCDDDEKVHQVKVKDFWIGQYEVTFNEWQACVDNGGCQANKNPDDKGWGRGKHPVINISWHDANQYADWLSQQTGQHYRLPTEAEWEYAARAGSSTLYPWSNNIICSQANYNYKHCGVQGTSLVGSYNANQWNLYDTVGNIAEWTCSAYPQGDNYNGLENKCVDRNDLHSRVLRGGSWLNKPRHVRSANRYKLIASKRFYNVGFRLSRIH